jgi:hypothetical protein
MAEQERQVVFLGLLLPMLEVAVVEQMERKL